MAPGEARTCPFCGAREGLTKEHVWPRWLRVAPGAQWLLETSPKGRRTEHIEPRIVVGDDDRYRAEAESVGHVQNLLPEVTVPICKSCNNGWLNDLERAVQPLLTPFLEGRGEIVAGAAQSDALAVWALKTFMTYAMTKGSQTNPFSEKDYLDLRQHRTVPAWVRLWICTADSRWAHVSLQLKSWVMVPTGARVDDTPDNCALGILAAGGAVFILAKAIPELTQVVAALDPPPARPRGALQELTRTPRKPLRLAPNLLDERYMDVLDQWMYMPQQQILPTPVGLTPQQVDELSRMAASVDDG